MTTRYPLSASTWDEAERGAIERVIASGRTTMGEEVKAFEREFAEHFGARHAVMVNSGSSANLLAIAALRYRREAPLRPGDEVIVPSLSWSTTFYPVHQLGLKLVFVDIDGDTLNLDPAHLEAARSDRTRAVFLPHILGNPGPLEEVVAFCQRHGLDLVEDTCESMGATLDGRQAGTFGAMGTYSLFFSHHITTMEGGVVVTDDEELHHILLSLRAHGWTRDLPKQNRIVEKTDDPFYESFRFVLPGYNVRPLEMSGAIGREQLRKLPAIVARRRANARHFQEALADDHRFALQQEHGESSWFGFSLVRRHGAPSRDKVVETLRASGIEVRPIVSGNFLRNDVLRHLDHRVVGEHRNSDRIHFEGLFVGNYGRNLAAAIDWFTRVLDDL